MYSRKSVDPDRVLEHDLSPSAARVLRRFRVIFAAVRGHFRAVEKKAGIAGAQLWALKVIKDHPGIRVGDLAKAMDVHQSTASNLLKQLLAAGLVVADRSHADRRTLHLQVSAAGAKLLKKAPGPFTGVLPEALNQMNERTLARLERDLGLVIALLEVDEEAANLPLGQPEP